MERDLIRKKVYVDEIKINDNYSVFFWYGLCLDIGLMYFLEKRNYIPYSGHILGQVINGHKKSEIFKIKT